MPAPIMAPTPVIVMSISRIARLRRTFHGLVGPQECLIVQWLPPVRETTGRARGTRVTHTREPRRYTLGAMIRITVTL